MQTIKEIENNAGLRIKFANIKDSGVFEYNSQFDDYEFLINEIEEEWAVKRGEGFYEGYWAITNRQTQDEIAITEHESGLEILITVITNIPAIVEFVIWAWKKWKKRREEKKKEPEPSIRVERVTEKKPDGTIRTKERIEIRGPLNSEDVQTIIDSEVKKYQEFLRTVKAQEVRV
ncbi:MAG: hypothetical protein ACFE9S_03330 [Candidatus Hermodarchaeota archaeon]